MVQKQIDDLWEQGKGFIYEIISYKPILSDEQQESMENGRNTKTMDEYANQQVYRMSEKAEENPNGLILNQYGMPKYRVQNFSLENKKDIIIEPTEGEYYVTPELELEMDPDSEVVIESNSLGDTLEG